MFVCLEHDFYNNNRIVLQSVYNLQFLITIMINAVIFFLIPIAYVVCPLQFYANMLLLCILFSFLLVQNCLLQLQRSN